MTIRRGDCGWVRDYLGNWSAVKIVRELREGDLMPAGRENPISKTQDDARREFHAAQVEEAQR